MIRKSEDLLLKDFDKVMCRYYTLIIDIKVCMKTIKVEELKKWLDEDKVLLIDVREPSEHKSESIEGAHSIPLGELSVEKLPLKSKPIVLHCRSGKRSSDACAKLLAQDPMLEIYSLEGGITEWKQAGFRSAPLP